MNSLYKKGDTVLIKSQYDKGCRSTSYRFIFVDYMLKRYGGKVCTILGGSCAGENNNYNQIQDDGYCYFINEDIHRYFWASSMFEPEF